MTKNWKEIVKDNESKKIKEKYFDDLDNPKNCRVCAIGALIQNLPDNEFNECYDEIKNNPHNGNGMEITSLPITNCHLSFYYGISLGKLEEIQEENDEVWT